MNAYCACLFYTMSSLISSFINDRQQLLLRISILSTVTCYNSWNIAFVNSPTYFHYLTSLFVIYCRLALVNDLGVFYYCCCAEFCLCLPA